MIDWAKLQPIYERKAYRIVQKHIKSIMLGIPYQSASFATWEYLITANITEKQIREMYIELYSVIGLNYGNRINKELEKIKKANVLFNEYLLREILVFLSKDGGQKIVTVHNTLIESIIQAIKDALGENATVIDLQNAIYKLIRQSQTFYKWQALRIARTETTAASNFAAIKTAEQSDLVLDKMWISVQDNRTRIKPYDHLDMNGQIVAFDSPFFVGGENIYYPGDPKASAGNVINCRCTIAFEPRLDANGDLIIKK